MYHFQRSKELEDLQIPYFPSPPEESIQQYPIELKSTNFPASFGKRRRMSSEIKGNNKEGITDENNLKKINHREVERQRRKEMANLYASLRSILPLEYIKGKRSVSDQMHEAVNYIKHLQKNICQLRLQKERFMKKPDLSTSSSGNATAGSCPSRSSTVKVNLCQNGVEILINCSPENEVFPISRVLRKMLGEGLNVICYLSSKVNDATLYRILSEVDDPSCVDIIGLQKKLMDVMQESTSQ